MLNIAIVGNFAELEDANLYAYCDLNRSRLQIKQAYPQTRMTQRFDDVISDSDIDAVVIGASAVSHFPLAKKALMAGKHVFIEKPMTLYSKDAEELVRLSEVHRLTLMVGV